MNIIDLATKTMQTAIKAIVDAIKTVVDATKTKVDIIDTRTNTMNTNINTINTNVGTILNGRVVKSVQRGTVNGLNNANAVTANISTIVPSKSFVLLSGSINSDGSTPYVSSMTATSVTIATNMSLTWPSNAIISWQVIEFY